MVHLQECYSHKPRETETEYLWCVCLSKGARILLNGDEPNGYWGPGVFLNTGPNPPDYSHSITSRVAYWAGGIDALEGGEPPIKSLDELSVAVTKAAFTQAMHEQAPHDVPVSTTVDFTILKPLIRGAPAVLKPYLIAKQDKIKRDTEYNVLLDIEVDGNATQRAIRHLPTWAELVYDSINHGRVMGWDDVSSGTRNIGGNIRQVKQPPQSGSY